MAPASARKPAAAAGHDINMLDSLTQGDDMADVRPFQLRKLGHVVLNVSDLDVAVRFYTEVLGLQISDRYPDSMVPGGMVFMRYGTDHHGVALVGGARALEASSLNHFCLLYTSDAADERSSVD